jgi:hypothetical protein
LAGAAAPSGSNRSLLQNLIRSAPQRRDIDLPANAPAGRL